MPEPFVVSEQEHFVLLNRASQRTAKLIALEWGCADGLIEEVSRVQGAVAQILEDISVQLVSPRGGDDADLPSGPLPVLGAVSMLDDVVLAHGFDPQQLAAGPGRCYELGGGVATHPIDAVDHISIGFLPLARDGEPGPAIAGSDIRSIVGNSGVERQKLIKAAPV